MSGVKYLADIRGNRGCDMIQEGEDEHVPKRRTRASTSHSKQVEGNAAGCSPPKWPDVHGAYAPGATRLRSADSGGQFPHDQSLLHACQGHLGDDPVPTVRHDALEKRTAHVV